MTGPAQVNRTASLLVLGVTTALGSMSIQMVVPALPMTAANLGVAPGDMQLLVSIYLAGLAAGQLAWATVIARAGPVPSLLAGLGLFALASAACAISPTALLLVAARLVQAVAAAGMLVACRIIGAHLRGTRPEAGPLALLSAITLLSPVLAPSIGGMIATHQGWRAIFWLIGSAAVLMLAISAMQFRPLIAGPGDDRPARGGAFWPGCRSLARSRAFLAPTLANALLVSSFYIFLTSAPFLLGAKGLDAEATGHLLSACACGLMLGNLLVGPLERRRPRLLAVASRCLLVAGALGLVIMAIAMPDPVRMAGLMILVGLGSGLTAPTLLVRAMNASPGNLPLATSIFGALQMASAATITSAFARTGGGVAAAGWLIAGLLLTALLLASMRPPATTGAWHRRIS